MAAGEIGLELEYFYSLTFRQFSNICAGYFSKKKKQQNDFLVGIRKVMYASLAPYQKKGFKESDLFLLDFEKEEDSIVDLEEEMRLVAEQKEYWEKVDRQRELSKQ